MIRLTNITTNALQEFTLTTDDNIDVTITLRYMQTQLSWVADLSDNNGFIVNGIPLVASPNILREFKDIITYGLGITSITGYDPRDLKSFSEERATMFLLSSSEVDIIESVLYE